MAPSNAFLPRGYALCRSGFSVPLFPSVVFSLLWCFVVCCWFSFLAISPVEGAAYFFVTEGTDRCFFENVPQGVAMTVAYNNPDNQGVTCNIIFKDPQNHQVFKREVLHTVPKGKVTYLTTTSGDYSVCISCASSKWISTAQLKWSLSIELGDTDINISQVAKKEAVGTIEAKMQTLINLSDTVSTEMEYERRQEEEFRNTSETVNSRVLWFSVSQILLLSVTTLFSIFHLTKFFQTQKLI